MRQFRVRAATASRDDQEFLRQMLYEAAAWRPGDARPPAAELLADPHISLYIEGWGRQGDAGVIAEGESHSPHGAAWYRVFGHEEHGYGFVRPDIPEIAIGVCPTERGQGIGTALLDALIKQARRDGFQGLSLSVEKDNPAARLYARVGFVRERRVGNAWTMLVTLN